MKKSFLSFLWGFAALSSLLVSCDDNGGNDGSGGIPCTINITATDGGEASFKDYFGYSMNVYTGESVTIAATSNEGYGFIGWYVGDSETPVSRDAVYTFVARGDLSMVAKFGKYINGHEYVDLGLPSGIKWATCNVGASSPEDYGGYYAWGETEEKGYYDWDNYKWCNGSENTQTKYCTDSDYGTVDNKTVLDLEDDVAHVKWGGSWRMPTSSEIQELLDECIWEWTVLNGVDGCRVTGPNGNSIFLPVGGDRDHYWSNSLSEYPVIEVDRYDVIFLSLDYVWRDVCTNLCLRCIDGHVRPVSR